MGGGDGDQYMYQHQRWMVSLDFKNFSYWKAQVEMSHVCSGMLCNVLSVFLLNALCYPSSVVGTGSMGAVFH